MSDILQELDSLINGGLEPTNEEIELFKEVRSRFPEIFIQMDKAKRAGMVDDEDIKRLTDLQAQIDRIIRVYG